MADRFRAALLAVLLWIAMPVAAAAQQGEGAVEGNWIEGRWQGEGRFQGRESTARLDIAPALGGHFLEFEFNFTAANENGEPLRFSGRGFYRRNGEAAWTGIWLDSGGAVHELRGAMTDDALETQWGDSGRTSYRLTGADRLEVVDSIRTANGEWREFARYMLVRLAPAR